MDNETSSIIENYIIKQNDTKLQFVEPQSHQVNAAERAVQTFKNHFVAGLCSVNKNFPLQLWDELLKPAQATLNALRTARTNLGLFAYSILEGEFNFDKTPLAPPGTRALVYFDPTQRRTWGPHTTDAWYLKSAMQNYQCYKFWIPETRGFRITQSAKKISYTYKNSTFIVKNSNAPGGTISHASPYQD